MARRRAVRAVQDRQELRRQGVVADPRGLPPGRHRAAAASPAPAAPAPRGCARRTRAPRRARRTRARRSAGGDEPASGHGADPRHRRAAGRPHDRAAGVPAADPGAGAGDAPAAAGEAAEEDKVTVLRGMPKTLAANMDESLTVPTATSVRTDPGEAHDRQPHRDQQPHVAHPRRQGQLHAPHRLGDHPGAQGVPEPERVLRRDRRQAVRRRARARQPRHRDRPAQARRHARAAGAEHQARRHADVRRVPRDLRGPHHARARQQADRRRLPGHDDLADQPRRHRHRALRAAPDEGPGLHRRRRRPRVPGRVPGREREDAQRARDRQDDHAHQHLRPPRHPGRRLGRVPQEGARAAHRAARLLRRHLRGAAHPVRARSTGRPTSTSTSPSASTRRRACRSSSTRSACAAT